MSLFKSNLLEIQDYELEWDLTEVYGHIISTGLYVSLTDWISNSKNNLQCHIRVLRNRGSNSNSYLSLELDYPSYSEKKTIYFNIGFKRLGKNNDFTSITKGKFASSPRLIITNILNPYEYNQGKQFGLLICCYLTEINLLNTPSKSSTYNDKASGLRIFENYKILKETLPPNISLNIGGDVLKVHKCILCSNSPVFAKMFEHDMKEKRTNNIDINNFRKETMESLIHFIYYDKPKEILLKNVYELYEAARFYQIDDLSKICMDFMINNLSHATVTELYNGALLHRIDEILKLSLEFMKNNLNEDCVCEVLRLALENNEEELITCARRYICDHGKTIFQRSDWKSFLNDNPTVASQILQSYAEQLNAYHSYDKTSHAEALYAETLYAERSDIVRLFQLNQSREINIKKKKYHKKSIFSCSSGSKI